jgi:membrane protein DedA with SNARE-associated domain
MAVDDPGSLDTPPPPARTRASGALLAICAVIYLMGFVGGWLGPRLLDRPELLLALDSRNRHLLAAIGAGITVVPFLAIAFVRLTVVDPFFYRLGTHHGERSIAWLEAQTQGNLGVVGWVQAAFTKVGWLVVLVMPNLLVSALAGTYRMPFKRFFALDLVGTATRLAIMWALGQQFRPELEDAVDFVRRYQWWFVGGLLLASVVQSSVKAARSGRAVLPDPENAVEPDR